MKSMLKGIALTAALVLLALPAIAATQLQTRPLVHGYWGRAGQGLAYSDSLDGTWVIKGNNTAGSWTTPDTLGPVYIGDVAFANNVDGTTQTAAFVRVTLNVLPLSVVTDSCYVFADFATSPNGPWLTGGTTADIAPTGVFQYAYSGTVAGAADTTGRGAWIANAAATYTDPTMLGNWRSVIHGQPWTTMIPIVSPATSSGAKGPFMFPYMRLRLRGDSSAATASALYLNGQVTIPVEVLSTIGGIKP